MKIFSIIRKPLLALMLVAVGTVANAQSNSNRINFGVGALYERGFDATLSVEHETRIHNAWEYFANGYIKSDKD